MFRTIIAAGIVGGAAITLDSSRSAAFLASDSQMEVSAEISESLQTMAMDWLSMHPVEGMATVRDGMQAVAGKLDLKTALKAVAHKNLPTDVQALVRSASSTKKADFDEASMAKARIALNNLVEAAWVELDDKIIECKEYQEMNRATFDQITTDISRLVEQITDLERVETESLEGISKTEMEIKAVEAEISKETKIYNYNYAKNSEELTKRQNDLDVFQFILTFTRCPDATSLLQHDAKNHVNNSRICAIKGGGHSMCFRDHATQTRFNQLMSHASRRTISEILAEVEGHQLPNFLQLSQEPFTTTPNPAIAAAIAQPAAPVEGGDNPLPAGFVPAPFCCEAYGVNCGGPSGGIMCSRDEPDCGLLHDKLSLMWGDYKDKVDELTMEMNKNAYLFEELKFTLNDQITMLSNTKARFAMMLSEARSNLAADREEIKSKQQQKIDVDKNYIEFMKKCCERVKWIMFQDMCALIVVRNAVLATSTECPGDSIVDCEVDNWVPQKCTVECDDSCPQVPDSTEVYTCGGWQHINRKVVVSPENDCGLRCPDLGRTKKCNQKKCPVDCEMSEWSGWSKCTADCEGGVKSRTRSLLIKPKNGGLSCNTAEETECCNTMSCDRDCTLADWTTWTPCSVACGGGMQTSDKHVLIPTRGFGKCPVEDGPKRHKEQKCNTQDCIGDEICVANQDLIIAIDGSGSLRESGFNILKSYALDLLTRYQNAYFGASAMKVGVIEFGNGIIMPDGVTVSPAMNLQALTSDLGAVKTALEGSIQKKGFTNMAQAFALAETMYTSAGRKGSQSALLVITDGTPAFQFQTNELVEQLDDKGVQRFFVVVSDSEKNVNLMKSWASEPWPTNLLHVPSLSALEADESIWAQKALTLFCPKAMSPSLLTVKETSHGFMHIKDGGYCGGRGNLLSTTVGDAEDCAFLANGAGAQSFLLGTWFRRGYCYAGTMDVDTTQYESWQGNRASPECPTEWVESMIFDFYAMEPIAED